MNDFQWPTYRKNVVHVSFILDRSGSMSSCWDDTIGGFNAQLEKFRGDKDVDYFISLTQFDDKYEINYVRKPLAEVKDLNRDTYVPRGMTALLDAVGKTIRSIGNVPAEEKLIVLITTDGYENASTEYKHAEIKQMIEEKDQLDNWSFVYMGAVADAWNQGTSLGISMGNIAKYSTDNAAYAFGMTASGCSTFACSTQMKTKSFYSTGDSWTDLSNGS